MAKGNFGSEDRAKVKLRVIEFELEGGNAAVENSIRQLTQALTQRSEAPTTGGKALPPKPTKELAAGDKPDSNVEDVVEEPEVLDAEPVEANGTPKATKPKTTYKPRVPQYLHEFGACQ